MKTRFATKTILACLLAVALHAPASAQDLQPIDRIAAVVNEDIILRSELERAVANVRAQYAGRENQLPPPEVLERQVLERLVLVKLQVGRAQENGIRVSDQEIEQAIGAIAGQNRLSVEQLRQQVVADGDGPSPELHLAPGDAATFSLLLDAPRTVGFGARASAERVEATLLDATGKPVASGVVAMRELAAGDWLLRLSQPGGTAPVRARVVVAGIVKPPEGPPEDVVRTYREQR